VEDKEKPLSEVLSARCAPEQNEPERGYACNYDSDCSSTQAPRYIYANLLSRHPPHIWYTGEEHFQRHVLAPVGGPVTFFAVIEGFGLPPIIVKGSSDKALILTSHGLRRATITTFHPQAPSSQRLLYEKDVETILFGRALRAPTTLARPRTVLVAVDGCAARLVLPPRRALGVYEVGAFDGGCYGHSVGPASCKSGGPTVPLLG
jgi:hypothetical protein